MEVEAQEPSDPHIAATLDSLKAQGIKCLYGRWLVEGSPQVILFDTGSAYFKLDEWKGDLWNLAGIPTPPNDHETNETIVFGYLVAWFLGEVSSLRTPSSSSTLTEASSTCPTSSRPASSRTSTSGRPDWLFRYAGSVTST